ncbi:MAG: hypothetical protein KME19_02015 [Microcoleus vaginatus WJT46-NPBG5]|jgi:hypothetical protein|nr:hypothetical protein [Microcoleus vaginatus WJT46-NPBG5]
MALRSLQETAPHHFSQFLPRRLSAFTLLGLSLHILHRLAIGCGCFYPTDSLQNLTG